MNVFQKFAHYFAKLWEHVNDPREANTEGGIFPAIFGTVAMVLLYGCPCNSFWCCVTIYLNEYATQGALTKVIRIAVNNLAGVLRLFMECLAWGSLSFLEAFNR